jgi:hypothetical protein
MQVGRLAVIALVSVHGKQQQQQQQQWTAAGCPGQILAASDTQVGPLMYNALTSVA